MFNLLWGRFVLRGARPKTYNLEPGTISDRKLLQQLTKNLLQYYDS
jgi:hypothetical protein